MLLWIIWVHCSYIVVPASYIIYFGNCTNKWWDPIFYIKLPFLLHIIFMHVTFLGKFLRTLAENMQGSHIDWYLCHLLWTDLTLYTKCYLIELIFVYQTTLIIKLPKYTYQNFKPRFSKFSLDNAFYQIYLPITLHYSFTLDPYILVGKFLTNLHIVYWILAAQIYAK